MTNKWMLLATPALALIAACGSDSKKSTPDALRIVDSPVTVDGPPACNISSPDFGDLGTVAMGFSSYDAGMAAGGFPAAPIVRLGAALTTATPPDVVFVSFYSGFTPFGTDAAPTAAVPGTYQLTGEQLQFSSCGVCVTATAKITQAGDGGQFMATGGSVKITTNGAAVGGTLAIELSNVTFEQATFSDMGVSTPVGNGCTTKITKLVYSGIMEAPPAKPGNPGQRTKIKLTRNSL